jgi:hypothetical protein
MSDQLYTLSYFSRNAIENQDIAELNHEITAILATARRANAQRDITGALLYSAGCFAQVLEGPLNEVETLFERIQLDPRHRDVKVLQFHPLEKRNFADWSMAFAGLEAELPIQDSINEALADPDKIVAGPDGLDFIAILHDLINRHEVHQV